MSYFAKPENALERYSTNKEYQSGNNNGEQQAHCQVSDCERLPVDIHYERRKYLSSAVVVSEEWHHGCPQTTAHPRAKRQAGAYYEHLFKKNESGQLSHRESDCPHERELYLAALERNVGVNQEAEAAEYEDGGESYE